MTHDAIKKTNTWEPIANLAEDVRAGRVTATMLVEKSLAAIAKDECHCILSVTTERAKARAAEIDNKIRAGEKVGRLAGVPFIAKDNYLAYGSKTTAASHILEPFEAPYQATAIERLEAEGAILVAKSNLDSFAHGSSTENSAFGPTLNPHDKTRVPGGSSGGSGAAVALGLAPFALGSDTGGSIRLPASFCGVVGLKPTYGLVSRYGVVAMASSTDVMGPFATRVEDAALVLDVMSGRDVFDSTTIERDAKSYVTLDNSVKGKKIGVIKEYFGEGLDPQVKNVVNKAIGELKEAGAEIIDVSIPSIELALACYYIIVPAEVSSNLSRYDGQRYGYSSPTGKSLDEVYDQSREHGFEAENKRRIMIGTFVLSSGYYDAYYKKAQTVRTKLINEFNTALEKVDFLAGPVAPTTAFRLGENSDDPLQMYLGDIMTVAVNLAGIPAISVPAGVDDNNLPIGLQLMSSQNHDRQLLSLAKAFEEINK
jgi:aspartyl-tRNA(Asn)/glutamyl-tRNA(Gln) amidotransferase subunit A